MDREEWMTVEEVAVLFKVSTETVRRWIRAGELKVLDLGGPRMGYRIMRSEVDAFARPRYGQAKRKQE
jgi:excisionase family DNA binding protein